MYIPTKYVGQVGILPFAWEFGPQQKINHARNLRTFLLMLIHK